MYFEKGDQVRYYFPEPVDKEKSYFYGKVEFVGQTHIVIKNPKGILLKVSYKNFEMIVHSGDFEVSEN